MISPSLRAMGFPGVPPAGKVHDQNLRDFRLTPHYRLASPLDDVLRNVKPGADAFVNEKYADAVNDILARWSSGLQQDSGNLQIIANSFAQDFQASSLRPSQRKLARPAGSIEIYRNRFSPSAILGKDGFIAELKNFLEPLSHILTAEFKITDISVVSGSGAAATLIQTRIRYDLVGAGKGFFRHERIGWWDLEWEVSAGEGWRVRKWEAREETESRASSPVFVDITDQLMGGNDFYREQMLHGTDYWRTVLDGASQIDIYGNNGVAVGDVDNDSFDDLYVCQSADLPNRLYRNRGDGTFEDVTKAAGVGVLDNSPCALFADLDDDGWQDLIVVTVESPLLFHNEGNGRFRFVPDAFRFAEPPRGTFTGAAVADYDRDGRLDVYFCLYSYYQGLNQYDYPTPYYDARNGPPNFLMHNNGDGTFTDVTTASGMNRKNNRYSFTCGWTDYNLDGWPDLYVVNDFGRKNLYRNNGDGTFEDVAGEAGVEDVGAGMSVCWFDYDNDGKQDLYVADMWSAAGLRVTGQSEFVPDAPAAVRALLRKHARGNSLFRNLGDGRFEDVSSSAGVEMGRWSWSSDAWDFDHDGYSDLYIANGMISDPDPYDLSSFFWRQVVAKTPFQPAPSHPYEQGWNAINELIRSDGTWAGYQRNTFYANNRDGTFSDVSGAVGLDFMDDSRTFALADFDHDGRVEIFLKNRTGPQLRVLKNVLSDVGDSISFRLQGTKSNRDAIGAMVSVEAGGLRQTKFLQAGSGFLSQHTKELFFGVGRVSGSVRATIRWPNGSIQHFADLPAGHRIMIEEGSNQIRSEAFVASTLAAARGTPKKETIVALPTTFETWLLLPVAAPQFRLPDVSGHLRAVPGLQARPSILNFWAVASRPSTEQLQRFERRQAHWKGIFELLAVNVDDRSGAEQARAFAREKAFSFPVLFATEDAAAIYNILFHYLYDRRRDLPIPTSFLLQEGRIVKVYQGPVDPERIAADARNIPRSAAARMAKGLPFAGKWYATEVHRNQLTYATVFFQRGYLDQALEACRLVLADDPENAEAEYLMGLVYLKKQKAEEARTSFERTLKLRAAYSDTLPEAWNNLGLLAAQQGRDKDAIRYFNESLRLNPHNVIALENLGNVYRKEGKWEVAQAILERAVEAGPDDPGANYSLGMVYAEKNDPDRAYKYLQRALKLQPDDPQALNNLGILYVRTRRISEAVATFKKCIRVSPDFDQPYLNLARIYAIENRPEQARTTLLELLKRRPDNASAQKALQDLDH